MRIHIWHRTALALGMAALLASPALAQRGGAGGSAPRSSPSVGGGSVGGRSSPSFGGGAPRSGGGFSGGSIGGGAPRSSPSPSVGSGRGGYSGAPSSGGYTRPNTAPRSSPSAGASPSRGVGSPSYSPRSGSPSAGAPSGGSPSAGRSQPSSGGASQPRYAPYGTMSGPSLYKGDGGGRASGGLSASGRGYSGSSSGASLAAPGRGTGGGNMPSSGVRGGTAGASPSVRGGAPTPAAEPSRGFRGFGAGTNGTRTTASDYRSTLANRVGRGGTSPAGAGSARSAVPSSGAGRGVVSPSYDRSAGAGTGRAGFGGRAAYDSGYHRDHHSHYHRNDDHIHFSFFVGFGGFGFGYYHGWNAWYHCYPAYYYPHYYVPVWYYPYWGYCYYPYYWSYGYFPYYRPYVYAPPTYVVERRVIYETVTVDGVDQGYRGSGYLPQTADDPYINQKDMPETNPAAPEPPDTPESQPSDVKTSSAEEALAPVDDSGTVNLGALDQPFVAGVATGQTAADAMAKGDELMKAQKTVEAAEAYRTAYQRAPDDGAAALRLSVALFRAGDYQLASWALVKGVGSSEKAMLDHAVMLDDLLGGKYVSEATRALEKSLIRRPNDEASNLLLAATYVMTGRTYAGYVILTRLKAAGYETATTDVYLKQAEAALKN